MVKIRSFPTTQPQDPLEAQYQAPWPSHQQLSMHLITLERTSVSLHCLASKSHAPPQNIKAPTQLLLGSSADLRVRQKEGRNKAQSGSATPANSYCPPLPSPQSCTQVLAAWGLPWAPSSPFWIPPYEEYWALPSIVPVLPPLAALPLLSSHPTVCSAHIWLESLIQNTAH